MARVKVARRSLPVFTYEGRADAELWTVADEAMGKSLDIIIPERQRQRHWDGYENTMATGETNQASRANEK